MNNHGLALVMLLDLQRQHGDPAAHHRAEILAARRAERRSGGRRLRSRVRQRGKGT